MYVDIGDDLRGGDSDDDDDEAPVIPVSGIMARPRRSAAFVGLRAAVNCEPSPGVPHAPRTRG